jgi:5-methylthioadenosine/S-adenosylhomocysteine deaminase
MTAPFLTAGAPADLILVNLNHPRAVPVHNVPSALMLCTHGSDVRTVIVDGKILLRDGRISSLDEDGLFEESRWAIKRLRERAGIY